MRGRSWLPWGFAGAFVGLYTSLFIRQATQLYVIDEAEFPLVSKGVAALGRPEYYRGDLLPNNLGIWHPPLYQYSLGVWEQLFGSSHAAVRSFGFACTILAAALGVLILRRLFPHDFPWLSAAWLGAFLLHPLAVQGSLLPDIDSTVLVPILMGMIWLAAEAVVGKRWTLPTVSILTGLLLGTAFLAKLTTPVALIPVAVFLLLRRAGSIRSSAGAIAGMAAIAFAVYAAVWGMLSRLIEVPFGYPLDFTRASVSSKSGGQALSNRIHLLWPGDYVQFWLTPALLILFLAAVIAIVFRVRQSASQILLCSAFVSAAIFFAYNVITGPPFGFPKYYSPIVGIGTLVIVGAFGLYATSVRPVLAPLGSGWRLITVSVCGLVLTSLCFIQFARNARFDSIPLRPLLFVVGTAAGMAVVILLLGTSKRRGPGAPERILVAISAGLFLATSCASASVSLFQANSNRSVRYYPGERDMAETVAKVDDLVSSAFPGAASGPAHLIAAKDIGYESGLPYLEDAAFLTNAPRLAALLAGNAKYFLVSRRDYDYGEYAWPEAFQAVRKRMHPVWTSPNGNFRIWESNTAPRTGSGKG